MAKKQSGENFIPEGMMNFIKFTVLAAGFISSHYANKYATLLMIQDLRKDLIITNMRIDYLPGSKPAPKEPTTFNFPQAILPNNNLAFIKRRTHANIY